MTEEQETIKFSQLHTTKQNLQTDSTKYTYFPNRTLSSLQFKEGWNSYEQVRRVTAEEAAGEAEQNIRITHNVQFVISASETWPFDVAPAFVWKFDFQNCDSFVRTRAKSELISEIFCNISLRFTSV